MHANCMPLLGALTYGTSLDELAEGIGSSYVDLFRLVLIFVKVPNSLTAPNTLTTLFRQSNVS